jgi:hypothetical protein
MQMGYNDNTERLGTGPTLCILHRIEAGRAAELWMSLAQF